MRRYLPKSKFAAAKAAAMAAKEAKQNQGA